MYLHNVLLTVNGLERHAIKWLTCVSKDGKDEAGESRYYEYEKKFLDKTTHAIHIANWQDTPHGGFWITITRINSDKKETMHFECSEWIEVCIILNSVA